MHLRFIALISFCPIIFAGLHAQSIQRIQNLDLEKLTALTQPTDAGNTQIISFWASWCKPCMEELPYFEKIKNSCPECKVTLVNLDFEKDIQSKVLPIITNHYGGCQITRLQGIPADDWMPVVNADWSGSIPATLIIRGEAKSFKEGRFRDLDELKNILLKL